IASISDIRDVSNPIDLERRTGVDVVLTISGDHAPIHTELRNLIPRTEVPLPLLHSPKSFEISDADLKVLAARTARWAKANGLMTSIVPPNPTLEAPEGGDVEGDGGEGGGLSEDQCTIR